jgi:hypothetical protein
MSFFYRSGGGGGSGNLYNTYDDLPGTADDGAYAIATNTGKSFRFSSVAGVWIPSKLWTASLGFYQDRSGTDISFTSPAISSFSGLSDYSLSGSGISDLSPGIQFDSQTGIKFSREDYTGDALVIIDVDCDMSGTSTAFLHVHFIGSHTTTTVARLCFSGSNKATDNSCLIVDSHNSVGTGGRGVFSFVAGTRIFISWNEAELNSPTGAEFYEITGQDTTTVVNGDYDDIGTASSYQHVLALFGWDNGALKVYRYQALKLA